MTNRVRAAVLSGYLCRHLDLSMEDIEELIFGLKRLLAELRLVGFCKNELRRAVRKAAASTHASLTCTLEIFNWSAARTKACVDYYDAIENARRTEMRFNMVNSEVDLLASE